MAENTYTIALAKNAEVVEFTYAQANIAEDFHFTAGNWSPSFGTDVAIGDAVTPTFDAAGVSLPGTWLVSASTYDIAPVTTAHVRWVGTGFTIQYSLNAGSTWTNLSNGQAIDLSGLTNPDLDFKVTFPGGVLNDTASLISLDIHVLKDQVIQSSSGVRNATISKPTTLSRVRGDQSAFLTDDGAVGGTIDIAADSRTEGPVSLRTIETWVKRNAATAGTIIDAGNFSGTASSSIRYYPRSDTLVRMVNTRFEVSNDANPAVLTSGTWTTVHTITTQPAAAWIVVDLAVDLRNYKYIRWIDPAGFGNISELEYYVGGTYSTGGQKLVPASTFGTPGSWNNSGATYDRAFDGNTGTFFDAPTGVGNAIVGVIVPSYAAVSTAADGTITVGPGMTVEVNGTAAVSGTTKLSPNIWYHVKAVYPTAFAGGFRLGGYVTGTNTGNFNFFGLAMYPNVPTNTYAAAVGTLTLRVDDSSTITVSESAQSVDMYAYAWAVVSASK